MPSNAPVQLPAPLYLGDGVYGSFDGYYFQLHLGDHRNPPVVSLEPDVLQSLVDYAKSAGMRVK